jgi:hypothetical protein
LHGRLGLEAPPAVARRQSLHPRRAGVGHPRQHRRLPLLPRRALAKLDLAAVSAQGYAFQIEMAFRMVRAGFRVKELPIHFVDRRVGKSKMDGKVAREALLLVPRLRGRVPKQRAAP